MRAKRAKQYKKAMQLYHFSYGFREPYQVLIDGNFTSVASSVGMDVQQVLERVLMGQVKLMSTYCVFAELKKLGPEFSRAARLSKTFEKRRCSHKDPVPAHECIEEIIGADNKFNYCVATQDEGLRKKLRQIPGVPLLYINKSVTILEPPSQVTLDIARQKEVQKTKPLGFEVSVKRKAQEEEQNEPPKPKKRKIKGPNPLSCKKKKPKIKQDKKNPEEKQEN